MGDRAPSEARPYREGWEVVPEMESSPEDELFTDLEAVREALDEVRCRAEASGPVALGYAALYETVGREMDRLRTLLADGPNHAGAEEQEEPGASEAGGSPSAGVYLCADSGGFSHDDPLSCVFVYRATYPQVLSDCPSGEDVVVRSDAEMEAWLARNWDLWKKEVE